MQFLYVPNAGEAKLTLDGGAFLHLKARRVKVADLIGFRNLRDGKLHHYSIDDISKRSITVTLQESVADSHDNSCDLIIAWCVVDSKVIEKTLPMLNELGVMKLILVWCEKSQGNVRLDLERFKRIIYSSCEQCGRQDPMQIEVKKPSDLIGLDLALIDFDGELITKEKVAGKVVVIGHEAGFCADEFKGAKRFSTNNRLIMRSETAIVSVAALIAM